MLACILAGVKTVLVIAVGHIQDSDHVRTDLELGDHIKLQLVLFVMLLDVLLEALGVQEVFITAMKKLITAGIRKKLTKDKSRSMFLETPEQIG